MKNLLQPLKCKHERVRCTHGEERLNTDRCRRCLECGRYLKGDLPEICHYTNQPHS